MKNTRDIKGRFSTFWKSLLVKIVVWVIVFFKLRELWAWSKPKLAVIGLMYLMGLSYFVGTLNGGVVEAEFIKEQATPPVLQRIMSCESQGSAKLKGTHYDKNGQVLMRSNTNRSVDVGIAQINTVWFKKAKELGYDITKEEDNKAMAEWIYHNVGTQPWYSSAKCWQK
jgi:hypothetical protein